MRGRGVFEFLSSGTESLLHSVRILSNNLFSLIFKKQYEVVTIKYQHDGRIIGSFNKTVARIAADTLKQTNAKCAGQPFRVITASQPEYIALGLNAMRLPGKATLNLAACDDLSRGEMVELIRALMSNKNNLDEIAYHESRIFVAASKVGSITVDFHFPRVRQFLTTEDANKLFAEFTMWYRTETGKPNERYQEGLKNVTAHMEESSLAEQAHHAELIDGIYTTALHTAEVTVLITAVREVALLSGLRKSHADHAAEWATFVYYVLRTGFVFGSMITSLSYIINKLTAFVIPSPKMKALYQISMLLALESVFTEKPTLESILSTTITRTITCVTSFFVTRGLIHYGYRYLTGATNVFKVRAREMKEIVDDEHSVQVEKVANDYTLEEIAQQLLQYAEADKFEAARKLLELLDKKSKNAPNKSVAIHYFKSILAYVYLDLPHRPNLLNLMCRQGKLKMVIMLLQYPVYFEYEDDEGTALMIAVRSGHLDIAIALMNAGANVKCLDPDSNDTLLHIAAKENHVNILRYLRKHCKPSTVDLQAVNKAMQTPLEAARAKKHVAAGEVLVMMHNDIVHAQQQAVRMDMQKQVEAARFSDQARACVWQESAGVYELLIPCKESRLLSAYFNYFELQAHQVEPDKLLMTEACVSRLTNNMGRYASLWQDYCSIVTAIRNLVSAAGFSCELTYTNQASRIDLTCGAAVALISTINSSGLFGIEGQSCVVLFSTLEKSLEPQRQALIHHLNVREEQYKNLRSQLHGVGFVGKEVKKIVRGSIDLLLPPGRAEPFAPLLHYLRIKRKEDNLFTVKCETLLARLGKPLPKGFLVYMQTRVANYVGVLPEEAMPAKPASSRSSMAVSKAQPAAVRKRDAEPAHVVKLVPVEERQRVYQLAKPRLDEIKVKRDDLLITNTFADVILNEIIFLTGLKIWFHHLPDESRRDPVCMQIKLEGIRLAVSRFLWAMHLRIITVADIDHLFLSDKSACDFRVDIAKNFIPAEELDMFMTLLMQENLPERVRSVVLYSPRDNKPSLQRHASLFARVYPVDISQRVNELMGRLARFVHHYDDQIEGVVELQIADALRTANLLDTPVKNGLLHKVRAMNACLVELVEIVQFHADRLHCVSGHIRHFMRTCTEMDFLSKEIVVGNNVVDFAQVSLHEVLIKAREGAEIWKKENPPQQAAAYK